MRNLALQEQICTRTKNNPKYDMNFAIAYENSARRKQSFDNEAASGQAQVMIGPR